MEVPTPMLTRRPSRWFCCESYKLQRVLKVATHRWIVRQVNAQLESAAQKLRDARLKAFVQAF